MNVTLFYAWQSDSPLEDNKHFLRDAAKDAVRRIASDADVEESPRLDHDTKDLPGTPEIAASIFSKIERCGMFLGDVTFVNSYKASDEREKKLPNPNVAIELGYAGRAIGWDRVILVMNTAYGQPEEQVFDIKHRRNPICFELVPGTDTAKRKEVRRDLAAAFEAAIRAHLKSEHEAVKEIVSVLDRPCLEVLVTFGQQDYFAGPEIKTMGQAVSLQSTLHAFTRLLEMRLLRCDVNFNAANSTANYAYHWTYLGRLTLRQLGIRQ